MDVSRITILHIVQHKVFQIFHDIKGQGGGFGYDRIIVLGNDLCRLIEDKRTARKFDHEVIDL